MIWQHSREELCSFLDALNSFHEMIKFTADISETTVSYFRCQCIRRHRVSLFLEQYMSRDLIYPFFNTSGNFSLLCFVLKKVLVDRNRSTNKHTTIKKPVVWLFILYFLLSSNFEKRLTKGKPRTSGEISI